MKKAILILFITIFTSTIIFADKYKKSRCKLRSKKLKQYHKKNHFSKKSTYKNLKTKEYKVFAMKFYGFNYKQKKNIISSVIGTFGRRFVSVRINHIANSLVLKITSPKNLVKTFRLVKRSLARKKIAVDVYSLREHRVNIIPRQMRFSS